MDSIINGLSHPIAAIAILLGGLIFFHEAGHFVVGRLCGISAEIFSIGFGPVIFKFKKGSTEYRLSLIPLGGFVKFYGSTPGEEVPEGLTGKSFLEASVLSRGLTIAAGPIANFILAIACYAFIGLHGIEHPPAIVGEILPGGAAERDGLMVGDKVTTINETNIETWGDLHDFIYKSPGQTLQFGVVRDNKHINVNVVVDEEKDPSPYAEAHGRIGITPGRVPSIVTIVNNAGIAAKSGIVTGDKVTLIKVDDKAYPIEYWRDLTNTLSIVGTVSSTSVEINFQSQNGEQKAIPLLASELSLSALGISDSQLTVNEIGDFTDRDKLTIHDQLVSVNGKFISTVFDFIEVFKDNEKEVVDVVLNRNGSPLTINLTLKPTEIQNLEGKKTIYLLPVSFLGEMISPQSVTEKYGLGGALVYGIKETIHKSGIILSALGKLIVGDMPLKALGGPISIAKVASDSVRHGLITFLSAMALVSINLGIINLVPIPVLDGGQLLILGIEGIRRKPLPVIAIENIQKLGFVMILGLVVMATYNDLSRFWVSMLKGVSGYFQ